MTCPERPTALLILGLGNLLCTDDGLGVVATTRLSREFEAPEGVKILDGGTLGLSLLPHLQESRAAILVDAIRADGPPGTIVRLEGSDVAPAVRDRLSPHQIGVADLLDGARWLGQYPDTVVLVGIVPASIELGYGLSPSVEAQLPALVDAVVQEAARQGWPLDRRSRHEPLDPLAALAGACVSGL